MHVIRRILPGISAALATLALLAPAQAADPGVYADRIVFGQAAVFEGPAAALGLGMREGLEAAFAEANAKGGVKGRKIELMAKNDGYEPNQAIAVVKELIAANVFALVGPVGTPTSAATHPIAGAAGVPFIGPFSGAELLRAPYKPHVVNVRASYFQETEAMVERLTRDLKVDRIAIFYQDDAYGRAGLDGLKKALEKRGLPLVAQGMYQRNTIAVKQALLTIRKAKPQAVVMVGAYKPCAEFIRVARQLNFDPVFLNVSFVGSDALAAELGDKGEGVVITQVVPFPLDASIPVVGRYHAALKAAKPEAKPGFVSLEGYIVGRLVVAAIEAIQGEPTRAALAQKLTGGSFDLGGLKLAYGAGDNQGSDDVFLTVIQKDGTFRPVTTLNTVGG